MLKAEYTIVSDLLEKEAKCKFPPQNKLNTRQSQQQKVTNTRTELSSQFFPYDKKKKGLFKIFFLRT
ncbi:MAG: hypothetical protein QW791_07420 [Candidatus Bathyarchaeia archaeon]